MTLKPLRYQQQAIGELVAKTYDLLQKDGQRHKLVFEAPTGSGKTVMSNEALRLLTEEVHTRPDSRHRQVAYLWIAPNHLHLQSYRKMKEHFAETRRLKAVMYDELDHSAGHLHAGEVLCINWESINKENNVIVRDDERNRSLFRLTDRTQRELGIPIVCIIDEEHYYANKEAIKSEAVLRRIDPKVELRISATPLTTQGQKVFISRQDVIAEEMIKEGIILNPAISQHRDGELTLNQHLTREALEKRDELAAAYRRAGSTVNPLLLIQLPNDTSETLGADEVRIVEEVTEYLRLSRDLSTDNGRLAVWLSNQKKNLEDIERPDSPVDVLLFKQAIALGWDCPRAAVLLIFRKLGSFKFSTQVVGRILRMPEQHYYAEPILNKGYVYTDLSREIIKIVSDDISFPSPLRAVRREDMTNVSLTSAYRDRPSGERNRLGSDFKHVLREMAIQTHALRDPDDGNGGFGSEEEAQQHNRKALASRIKFDVRNIEIELPEDMAISDVPDTYEVEKRAKFARTASELRRTLDDFLRGHVAPFERTHSTGVLRGALLELLEVLFGLYDTEATKVVLYHRNKPLWGDLIDRAVARYAELMAQRRKTRSQRAFATLDWEVPAERLYDEQHNVPVPAVHNHALMPFIREVRASTPEQRFEAFLEEHIGLLDWWYKNGDSGRQHFAVPYERRTGERSLFYVDFIVRTKAGMLYLFDTKTEQSDEEAPNKHNALREYLRLESSPEQPMDGGVIIAHNGNWYYPEHDIHDTQFHSDWTRLDFSAPKDVAG